MFRSTTLLVLLLGAAYVAALIVLSALGPGSACLALGAGVLAAGACTILPQRLAVAIGFSAVMGALALGIGIVPAFAADGTSVTAGPLVSLVTPWFEAIASGVVTALLGFAAVQLQRYTGVKVDASYREAPHSGAMTGVRLGLSKLQSLADAQTVDGKAAVLLAATEWMAQAVPGAIGHFGLDKDAVTALAESKLAAVLLGAAGTGSAAPLASADAAAGLGDVIGAGVKLATDPSLFASLGGAVAKSS